MPRSTFPSEYNRLPDGRKAWLAQANDQVFVWESEYLVAPEVRITQEYGWSEAAWTSARIRDEIRPGDPLVLYQAGLPKRIVGFGRVGSRGRRARGSRAWRFSIDWGLRAQGLDWKAFQADEVLSGSEKAKVVQGTLFRLSLRELNRVVEALHLSARQRGRLKSQLSLPVAAKSTASPEELMQRANSLVASGWIEKPRGCKQPERIETVSSAYVRDAAVVAFVLARAKGRCDACRTPGPFRLATGVPFLEVHHIRPLAAGGSDTVANVAALCPNCHRAMHLAIDSEHRRKLLAAAVRRKV